MAEQPTNVHEFPLDRARKQGTEFSNGDELRFHESSLPRNVGDSETMARTDVENAYGEKKLDMVAHNIEQAVQVGRVLAFIRPQEISDDAARKAA